MRVRSYRCGGEFEISRTALVQLPGLSLRDRAKLTTMIVDSNRLGESLEIGTWTLEEAKRARALSVAQRMDRFLLYLAHRDFRPGAYLTWLTAHIETDQTRRNREEVAAWIEAEDLAEVGAFRILLEGTGMLQDLGSTVGITAAGFARMDELRRGGGPTRNAFVAMWFGSEMSVIYDEGIEPAIRETGFEPVRIDRKEHVNKIDDEIVAEIKRSRFVFADFTSGSVQVDGKSVHIPRGGVYYEAGLAGGREIPVIWSVREDQIDLVHFDTRQFNHITWTNAEELRTKLRNRIRAIFADAT